MSNNTHLIEVSESTFQKDVVERSRQLPVIVDFWAPWCGPCRMLSPTLERVTAESGGAFVLAKVNVDDNPNLAARYGVQGIPAVKVFRDGRVAGEFVGTRPERDVREFIKTYAPSAFDRQLVEAQSLVANQRWDEAAAVYRSILAARPDHSVAALQLGQLLLKLGPGVEAEAALRAVPGHSSESVQAEALLPLARLMAGPSAESSEGLDAMYWAAGRFAVEQRFAEALETLLEVLRKNRNYRNGEAKRAMLALFEYLGGDPLVGEYRRKLASVLF